MLYPLTSLYCHINEHEDNFFIPLPAVQLQCPTHPITSSICFTITSITTTILRTSATIETINIPAELRFYFPLFKVLTADIAAGTVTSNSRNNGIGGDGDSDRTNKRRGNKVNRASRTAGPAER